jgi:hypothetical protein
MDSRMDGIVAAGAGAVMKKEPTCVMRYAV